MDDNLTEAEFAAYLAKVWKMHHGQPYMTDERLARQTYNDNPFLPGRQSPPSANEEHPIVMAWRFAQQRSS